MELAARLLAAAGDDRMKLFATMTMLRYRRERRELFERGGYEAPAAAGARRDHVFACAVLRAAEIFEHLPIALLESA